MMVSKRFFLSRSKLFGFLEELEASDISGSLYLPSGLPGEEVEESIGRIAALQAVPEELAGLAAASKTGAVVFWGRERTYLVLPPFPVRDNLFLMEYSVEPLRSLLERDYRVALVLIRLGAYAVGLCRGESLVTSKVGTGLIHSRHKKGGSSQQRFARHREKQIESFMSRVGGHIREQLEAHAATIDFLVYGGARTTIALLRKQCPFLARFDDVLLPPLLDIAEPRQAVLEKAIKRLWATEVTEWRDKEAP